MNPSLRTRSWSWVLGFVTAGSLSGCGQPGTLAENPLEPARPVLFSEGFDDAKLLDREWYDRSVFLIATKDLHSGQGCLEHAWAPGGTTPNSSSGLRRLFSPTDTVYVRFYLRLSAGWGWSGRSYHPHLLYFLTTENGKWHGPAASHLTIYVEPVNGKLRLAAQDIQNADQPHGLTQGPLKGGYNARVYDSEEVLFDDDRWHCIEALFTLNSIDGAQDQARADGVVRGWVDGKLVIDRADIVLRSSDFPRMQINHLLLAPYFGPGLLPHAQTLWIDDLVVGTSGRGDSYHYRCKPRRL